MDNWVGLLPIAEFAYNNSITQATGVTAGEERGRNPRNSRRAGTGTRERKRARTERRCGGGQGAAGDSTFRDSDGGVARADLAR
jgi:hypothetical protein